MDDHYIFDDFNDFNYEWARCPDAAQVSPDFLWIAALNYNTLLLVQAGFGHCAVGIFEKPFSQPGVARKGNQKPYQCPRVVSFLPHARGLFFFRHKSLQVCLEPGNLTMRSGGLDSDLPVRIRSDLIQAPGKRIMANRVGRGRSPCASLVDASPVQFASQSHAFESSRMSPNGTMSRAFSEPYQVLAELGSVSPGKVIWWTCSRYGQGATFWNWDSGHKHWFPRPS